MSLHTFKQLLIIVLTAWCQWAAVYANSNVKVGASHEVSALPVFASEAQPVSLYAIVPIHNESADTMKAGACEKGETVLNPDSIVAQNEGIAARNNSAMAHGNSVAARDKAAMTRADSITAPIDTARLRQVSDSIARKPLVKPIKKPQFVPNPQRALWLSLVLPGAGQIYNRKYWKLPFIYGGFLGCAYALMWNQTMYRDYSQAYLDIMDDDPNTHSYLDILPPRYDITGREEQFKTLFKRKKDYYRRYRDLSAFCFVGVYLLSVVDAYVDAQLSVFDISPNLSMSVEPAVMNAPGTLSPKSRSAYGVGCSLHF